MKLLLAVSGVACLVLRAYSKNSLTPLGLVAAAITAIAHALHPMSLPFSLLLVFFLGATKATTIKHDIKAKLTTNSSGSEGGEGARSHVQVYANTICATILSLLATWHIYVGSEEESRAGQCWTMDNHATTPDFLLLGVMANYATVAADTFSSELGILSKNLPRLITSWSLKKVPHGTNGGVSLLGLLAGILGATTITLTAVVVLPICSGVFHVYLTALIIWYGFLGTLLDSLLGGWFQATVMNPATGKVVESSGGVTVPRSIIAMRSFKMVNAGADRLDNNEVNLLSSTMTSLLAIYSMAAWRGALTATLYIDTILLLLGIFITWKVW